MGVLNQIFVEIREEEKDYKNVRKHLFFHYGKEKHGTGILIWDLESGSKIRIRIDPKFWIRIRIEINSDPKHCYDTVSDPDNLQSTLT